MAVPEAYAELMKLGMEGPLALARPEEKSKSKSMAAIDDASAQVCTEGYSKAAWQSCCGFTYICKQCVS